MDDIEAEVLRARSSFEQGLREASRASSRAARRVLGPAMIGAGLAGGALLLLALFRLARRPPADGALIRIVIEPPRPSRKVLPAALGALARWALARQLEQRGPFGVLGAALGEPRAGAPRNNGGARELVRFGNGR